MVVDYLELKISGGDLEISITGHIASKYPDVYPEAELSKFLKVFQYKGVLDCDNTILRQFKTSLLIILNWFLAVVLLLGITVAILWQRNGRLRGERERYRSNTEALLMDTKRIRVDSTAMDVGVNTLRLTVDEYKRLLSLIHI